MPVGSPGMEVPSREVEHYNIVSFQMEGETAVYQLEQRNVEFTGEKVMMKDREGNVVQGRRVLYLIDSGKVEVKGKSQTPPASPAAPQAPQVPQASQPVPATGADG